MIVFDLKCSDQGHVFEGWFASSSDYAAQKDSGLLVCPICGDFNIEKAAMAPAVPAKGNQRVVTDTRGDEPKDSGSVEVSVPMAMDAGKTAEVIQALAKAQAEILKNSEWVGRKFADQARAMHYGEEDHKPIHGEVAPEEARNLIEEGVEVAPLLFPVVSPEKQN